MHVPTLTVMVAGIVLATASAAIAGVPTIAVPGPGALSVLAVGVAAIAVGARWIRRR